MSGITRVSVPRRPLPYLSNGHESAASWYLDGAKTPSDQSDDIYPLVRADIPFLGL